MKRPIELKEEATFPQNDNFSFCDANPSNYDDRDKCFSIESMSIKLHEDCIDEVIHNDDDYNDDQQITTTEVDTYTDDEQVISVELDDDDEHDDDGYYCEAFVRAARQANLSKLGTNNFLSLIKSVLPVPNNLPVAEEELLTLLNVINLFTKRTICLLCKEEFDNREKFCPLCCSTDKRSIAFIYDSNVELILKQIVNRLSFDIDEYKQYINNNDDHEQTKDIPFGNVYQNLLKKNDYRNLISLLLHVDGIGITSSTKLKMWMFSGSVVELPPKLRSQRSNMVIISIWIAYVHPPPKLWLSHCIDNLDAIKIKGIRISDKYYKLLIFGITGDCPALKGQHMERKMQFHYELIHLRSVEAYSKLSNKSEKTNSDIYGHRGESILIKILDVELPHAIVLDYLHISLLGHDQQSTLSKKLRSFDNFAFVKATEIRNMLFYGLLPHFNSIMHIEQYSHFTLYVCALRLLHSGHIFGDKTSTIAHQLFIEFYKDHELFYAHLQHFKLHLHIHLSSLYDTHGSLCNLGCFGQESLIGFVSANHHGTQYHGDSIVHFYNIDFAIQNKKEKESIVNGPYDLLSVPANNYHYLKEFHTLTCTCNDLDLCCKIYRRFIVKNKMFHSLIYNKRGNSVNYFVQYIFDDNGKKYRFGIIDIFFTCDEKSYAVLKHHPVKCLFSETFKMSSYYYLLKKTVDKLYFVLEYFYSQFDIIPVCQILNHCIVVDKNDYLFVTNVLSYNEHD
ncbi:hypothetical protein I4U23_004608 [Adineta vaga]|nr:hypothetical protein I4U23_004608 [Adineta vaga]